MALDFTITETRIINEFLPAAGGGKTNGAADGSIGVPMRLEVDVELASPDEIPNTKWRFAPALFIGSSTPASGLAGYYIEFGGTVPETGYQLDLFTDNAYASTQANVRAGIFVTSPTTATLKLFFRMTMDMGGFLSQNEVPSWKRFRRPHITAPSFANDVASVYRSTNRRIGVKVRVENAAGEFLQKFAYTSIASRYYNNGLPTVETEFPTAVPPPAAEFSPGLEVKLLRDGEEVTGFAPSGDTEVRLYFDEGTTYTIQDRCEVYLIRMNPPNAGLYLDDYGSRGSIVTSATTEDQNLGYGIKGIATGIDTEDVGGTMKNRIRFKVSGSYLDPAQAYGLVLVVGGAPVADADQTFTNSFFWKEEGIPANQLPAAIPMADAITGTIADYNADAETDNVISTVVDHLRSKVTVDATNYDGAQAFASTWGADLVGIKLRFENVVTNELMWVTEYTRQGGSFVNIAGDTGNNITETVDGQLYTYSTLLHMCYPNDAALPDFSGKNIRVVWQFVIAYPAISWTVLYNYPQYIAVEGYKLFGDVIKSIRLFEYATGLPVQNLCATDQLLVEVLLEPSIAGAETWNIRAFWSLERHGYQNNLDARPGSTREAEAYTSPSGELTEITDASIIGLPPVFASNRAVFIFDHALVPIGQKARIHVIAEPEHLPAELCCSCEHLSVSGTDYPDANSTYEIFDTPVGGYPARRNSFGRYIYWEPGGGSYWVLGTGDGNFLAPPEYASPCLVPRNEWYPDPGNPASGPLPIVCGGIIQSVRVVVDGVIDAVFDFVDVMNSRPALGYDDSGNTWGLVYTGADWAVYDTVNGYVFTNPSDVILPKDITGTWTAIGTAGPVPELFNMPCDY
jgi:hypothetical protein